MAFSILRFSGRSALGIVEKTNCLAALASSRSTGLVRQIDNESPTKQRFLPVTSGTFAVRDYSKQAKKQKIRKGYSSASESESDDERHEHRPRAESEFWRRKMRTVHAMLDLNKDGVISYDDFKLLADKFVNLGHLSAQEEQEFRYCIKELWESHWGEITPYNLVTVEQYLEDMHHVLNDKQLKKKVHSFLPYLFKAIDKEKHGQISEEEFRLFFECMGIDEVHAVATFSLLDTNSDGKLSLEEFVKHGRDYFLTENECKISKLFWGPLVEH